VAGSFTASCNDSTQLQPPRAVRELRDLTRRRRQLLHDATSERNRIEKVPEDANIKPSSVLADLFGVSGQLMLEALLEGKATASEIAQLAKRKAKLKIPELTAAMEGHRMSDHHRRVIRYALKHLAFLEQELFSLDEDILRHIESVGLQPALQLLQTLPGVQQDSAVSILAEVGADMSVFPSAAHLSSWAGRCPGNRRSAGKDKGGRRGNRVATLTQCAWAAASKKDCHLKGKFWRLAAEGKKGAIGAVAHALLVLVYQVLAQGKPYQERGPPVRTPATTPANPAPHSVTWPFGNQCRIQSTTSSATSVADNYACVIDTNIRSESGLFSEQQPFTPVFTRKSLSARLSVLVMIASTSELKSTVPIIDCDGPGSKKT
jgi:transposase